MENEADPHSPTLTSLHLRHSSFSNPSATLHTSQLILQPFRCFSYVIGTSPTSELILQPFRRFTYVTAHSTALPLLYVRHRHFTYIRAHSPTLSSTTAFFILSVHFTLSILLHNHISNASTRFCSFRRSVQVSALHTKHFTSLFQGSAKNASFSVKSFFCLCYPLLDFLTAVHVATDITPQVFEVVQ